MAGMKWWSAMALKAVCSRSVEEPVPYTWDAADTIGLTQASGSMTSTEQQCSPS